MLYITPPYTVYKYVYIIYMYVYYTLQADAYISIKVD